ncbi:MAG: hypothetical protein ACRDOY_11195 [Nocardioidaceae bacterium]
MFACETYTYDRAVPYHLDYPTVSARARQFETGRLVLTHMGPSMLDHLADVDHTTAYDGMDLTV